MPNYLYATFHGLTKPLSPEHFLVAARNGVTSSAMKIDYNEAVSSDEDVNSTLVNQKKGQEFKYLVD